MPDLKEFGLLYRVWFGLVWYGTVLVLVILGYTLICIVLGPISLLFRVVGWSGGWVVGHFGNKAYLKSFGLGFRSGKILSLIYLPHHCHCQIEYLLYVALTDRLYIERNVY